MEPVPKTLEVQLSEAQQEIARLKSDVADSQTLFEFVPVALAIAADPLGKNVRVNSAFAKLLGIEGGENASLTGNPPQPFRFVRENKDLEESERPLPAACQTGEEQQNELEIVRADGQRFHVFCHSKPVFDDAGAVRGGIAAYFDLTERREHELALERTLAKARSANEELQQFAYAASHDLQEPLRSIAAYSQLLQRHFPDNSEAGEFINFIVDGVNRMNALIRDLLSYSRMGTSPRRTTMNLKALAQWSLLNLERSVREAGAQVNVSDLPDALVDETQMVQLFQNLVSNSLKYRGPDPPCIEISHEETDSAYVVAVKDNGLGIEPRFQQQVFGVFKRLHGRDIPGTGIGLALCRKIVEGHGGKIWVESDGKTGSTFKFSLPFYTVES